MHRLFFTTSPNVYKIVIALEELGLQYELIPVDLSRQEQKIPENIGGSISGKLPVLTFPDPDKAGGVLTIFESGAILSYLAEQGGPLACRRSDDDRREIQQWLFWQVSGLGPFSGQCFHFRSIAPAIAPDFDNSYSKSRYERVMSEHWSVMERRLEGREYLCADYSVADIACFPWIDYMAPEEGREAFPRIEAWRQRIKLRPAVVRAYERARAVDMGYVRNELDTVIFTVEQLKKIVTL
jgi:GST-like protein